jgi:hypothetical protein
LIIATGMGIGGTAAKHAGMALVDSMGRRPLLVWGSLGCGGAMLGLCVALVRKSVWLTAVCMCMYILSFSMTWAGVFWVICSEIFSMSIKSAAMALAMAALFLSGAISDFLFPFIVDGLGGGAFVLYACLSVAGGVYVYLTVPETKGLTLLEVQRVLQRSR